MADRIIPPTPTNLDARLAVQEAMLRQHIETCGELNREVAAGMERLRQAIEHMRLSLATLPATRSGKLVGMLFTVIAALLATIGALTGHEFLR